MDFFDLLIILFILVPVLEGLFGKKAREKRRQQGPQPGQSPQASDAETPSPARSAGEMVPDDLWELLTGERRSTTTQPVPTQEWGTEEEQDEYAIEAWEPDEASTPEYAGYEPDEEPAAAPPARWQVDEEAAPLETTRLPEARSLETPVAPEPVRHAAFHRRLRGLPPPARTRRPVARDLELDDAADLRRAVILREVLGPPKAFQ